MLVGYRYYTTKQIPVRFPFGHGLSYTDFSLLGTTHEVHAATADDEPVLTVTTTLANTGRCAGKETLQLYIGIPEEEQPVKVLKQFEKVSLSAGEEKEVSLTLCQRDLMVYSAATGSFSLPAGEYRLYLGTSVEEICYEATFSPIAES